MPMPSEEERKELREKIVGLGETSMRKSYYPSLQSHIHGLELYKALLNEASDAIGLIDLHTLRFVDLNKSARKWFAVSPDEPLPVFTTLFDTDTDAAIRQWTDQLAKEAAPVLNLTTLLRPVENSDDYRYIDLNLSHVRFGDCDYAVAVLRDVTAQKKADNAFNESERRYKDLVASVPVGICMLVDRTFHEVNQRFCEIVGYSREELVGNTTRILYASQEDFEQAGKLLRKLLETQTVVSTELQLWRKDGRQIDVLLTFSALSPQDRSHGVIYSILDITDRKHTERALADNEKKLKSIVSVAPVGIAMACNRIIKEANQKLCEISGYSREELMEHSSRIFYFSEEDFERVGNLLYDDNALKKDTLEVCWRHKDGHSIDVFLYLSPIDSNDLSQGITFIVLDITDRKRAEQAMLKSENMLKSIISNAPVGIIMAANRILKEINPKLCELTGYSRMEILNQSTRILYSSQEEFERVGQLVYLDDNDFRPHMVEARWRHKDGHPIDVAIYFTPLDALDLSKGVTFIIMDITEQKRAEAALRDGEIMMRSILSSVPSGIGVVHNRVFLEANQKLCEITGYSREELIGRNSRIVYWTDEDYQMVGNAMYPLIVNGNATTHETRWRHKDGRQLDILLSLTLVDPNRLDGPVTFTALDITERKKAEAALRASEENLRITLNSIGDAVIASDCNGKITRLNPVAAGMTGWSVEDAIEQPLEEVFHLVDGDTGLPTPNPFRKVITDGHVVGLPVHTVLLARDGREFRIADSGAPIRNDRDEIIGMVLVFHDITKQFDLEEKLRQSQKLESIGKLAGGVAHDFNNMLTGIMASADLLNRRIDQTNTGAKTLVGIIRDSCQKAADLTQKLLAFARKAKMVSRPVDIHSAIDTAVNLLERSIDRKIEIVRHFQAQHFTITGDPSQMANMFLNLGVNARDAMSEGGVIMIETENIHFDQERCGKFAFSLNSGDYLHIRFSDTGCGISEDIINRVFEPFFTTKEVGKGSGLGLSAVYGAVQEHGGAIEVASKVEHGTVFDIYLPCTEDNLTAMDTEEELPLGNGCVLVVDDEELVRYTAKEILEEIGFKVLMASDGVDGLEKYARHRNEIDLVMLDMIMPRMNGQECFAELRKMNPNLKIVISTGYISDRTTNAAYPEGASGFIRKPFTITELHREINKALLNQGSRPDEPIELGPDGR